MAEENLVAICDYLGLKVEEWLGEKMENENDQVDIQLLLRTIEHDINLVGTDEAWQELQKIKLELDDPLLGEYYFLQARLYETSRNWGKAQKCYEKAIRFIDQFPILRDTNLQSVSYYGLGRIFSRQNNLKRALIAVKKGVECFVGTTRNHFKYNLLLSQAIYLEKLNQNEEAFRITKDLWKNIHSFASSEAKTNLAQLQATLHNKFGFYDESIYYSEEGLVLARSDKLYDRSLELWTTQGESYRKKGLFANAKLCLKTALNLKEKIHYPFLAISTYTQLGLLYLELNDFRKSQITLEQAVTLGEETKDNLRLMSALIALGDCYLHQQQLTNAQKQFEIALTIAQTHSYIQHE